MIASPYPEKLQQNQPISTTRTDSGATRVAQESTSWWHRNRFRTTKANFCDTRADSCDSCSTRVDPCGIRVDSFGARYATVLGGGNPRAEKRIYCGYCGPVHLFEKEKQRRPWTCALTGICGCSQLLPHGREELCEAQVLTRYFACTKKVRCRGCVWFQLLIGHSLKQLDTHSPMSSFAAQLKPKIVTEDIQIGASMYHIT